MAVGFASLPDELISQVLLKASTPTFIQLTRTSKNLFHIAAQNKKVLLHHLHQLPGDKSKLENDAIDCQQLFLLLRQRATNSLTGINLHANVHEYAARGVAIDPVASSIGGLDADYVRMALCFKGSADIRQYTSHCAIKEKIKQISGPGVKVLKLVQWGRFVSALCFSPPHSNYDELSDTPMTGSSESESEVLIKKPFTRTTNAQLQYQIIRGRNAKLFKVLRVDHRYQVVHFDVYTMEDSLTFEIIPRADVVPRDFAVQDTSHCAILWDRETPGQRPTEAAFVTTYTIDKRMQDTVYEQKTVWPKQGKPPRSDTDSDDEDTPEDLPERIAFFKDGKRIKMYHAGGIVPYHIFSTASSEYDQYAATNLISFDGFSVHVDTPFFGTHTTQLDELNQQSYCFQHHLCLGVATLNLPGIAGEEEVKILCILRSQHRYYPEGCQHQVSLSRMTHVSANNSTIVARLWGWDESSSSFSGKDTVAVSPGGTRIAIAMWNKVLVYPLNPKVLCDEVVVDSSDDESVKPKKKKKKLRKSWETPCTDYYPRKKDKNLLGWKVAELRPIVLDLDGAVAHKMSWSPAKGPVTDTEEPVVAPTQDVDSAEDEVVIDDAESANTEEVLPVIPPPDQTASTVPGVETPILSAQPTIEEAISQASVTVADEQAVPGDTKPTESDETDIQVQNIDGQGLPEGSIAPTTTAEPSATMKPEQVSNPCPQSPSHATKKLEVVPTSPIMSGAVSLPPTTINTLTSTFPPSPFSPYGMQNASQPSKPSTRKKEKAPETTTDSTSPAGLEKKFQTALSLTMPESSPASVTQPSWPPPTNKIANKPNQTVAEALSANPPMTTTSIPEVSSPPITNTSVVSAPIITPQVMADTAPAPPEVQMINDKIGNQEEAAITNNSKNSTIAAESQPKSQDDGNSEEGAEDKFVKRKKRITEDELIILTDRGIQIWNLGARAKGKRKKSVLRLEESLKGKLPRMKGKKRETIAKADDSD